MTELLTGVEKTAALTPLLAHGWSEAQDGTALTKRFLFASFIEAFSFMTRVALSAEKMDHHPDGPMSTVR